MSTFDDLMKDKVVSEHPLLKGYHKLQKRREAQAYPAHGLQEGQDSIDNGSLNDIFSMRDAPPETRGVTSMRDLVFEASKGLHAVLSQFILPISPKVSYNNVRDVKYARDSQTDIREGLVLFNVQFISKSGVRKEAVVPVKVMRGEALPPSVMEIEGRLYTVSQDSLDMVLERVTSYELPELRGMYDAPLNPQEKALAVGLRDYEGPLPRDNNQDYTTKVKHAAIGTAATPAGFPAVMKDIEEAEKRGLDTFPRPWIYLLRNYILNHVSVASRDAWEPHLINKSIAINPYGNNRGRRAQVMDMGEDEEMMGKEVDLEVSAPPMDMEEVIEEVIQQMYPGTRTPIESGDGVKFGGPKKDKMRGNIVEVNPDNATLIIKSKGMEYRVKVEEIEPMPSTFKKMYM